MNAAKDTQDGAAHQIYEKEKELTVCVFRLSYRVRSSLEIFRWCNLRETDFHL